MISSKPSCQKQPIFIRIQDFFEENRLKTVPLLFETRLFKKNTKSFVSVYTPLYFRIYETHMVLSKDANYTNCKTAIFSPGKFCLNLDDTEKDNGGFKVFNNSGCINEFSCLNTEDFQNIILILKQKVHLTGFEHDFLLLKKIGEGYFGKVYLIKNLKSNHLYAGKIVKRKQTKDIKSCYISGLKNEISILQKLNDPNLIKLICVYEEEEYYALVFEYYSGGNLKQYIHERGILNEGTAALVIRNVLQGLKSLHSLNIMHRDVKPENILFRSSNICDKYIVLADFGLATSNDVSEYLYAKCGTPGYIAPEILNLTDPKGHYDLSCDLFSVGVTLFFVLTGGKPYEHFENQDGKHFKRICFEKNERFNALSPPAKSLISQLVCHVDKRITIDQALSHEFFEQKVSDFEENVDDILCDKDCEDSLPCSNLKEYNKRETAFKNKNFMNILASPTLGQNNQNPKTPKSILSFVCHTPILNGFTKTLEFVDSANKEEEPSFGRL